jgi:hypothetical protein
MESVRPLARMILVIVVMVAAETAWTLFCAETDANLLLYYAVLVAASAVFFIPGLAEKRGSAPRQPPMGTAETNR